MFGTNKIRKQELGDGRHLEIQDIFPTIQGEGPFAGEPAIFVRLAGCHLKCHFCIEGSQRVLMADYSWKPIQDVRQGDLVIGLARQQSGQHLKYVPTRVETVHNQGRQSLICLGTNYCSLMCTPDHQVMINTHREYWQQAESCLNHEVRTLPPAVINDEFKRGWCAGYILGDGNFHMYKSRWLRFKVVCKDPEPLDRLQDWAPFPLRRIIHKGGLNNAKTPGLECTLSQEAAKFREWLLKPMESLSYAQGWLAGMYDAEGHLDSAPRLSQSFVVNPEKCQQIEQYLTICDIKYNKQACGKMNIYIISDGAAFLSICPPATHRKRLRDWSLRSAKDEVVNSVKLAGSGETFDLTTGTHNFICEGFPVHNCDTDFESKSRIISLPDILNLVEDFAFKGKIFKSDLVVITGGEPFRQNIFPLCDWLLSRNFRVQIETAGNLWVNELELFFEDGTPITIVCSPKTGKVHEKVQKYCHDWKYLIQEGQTSEMDGLPTMSTQVPGLKQNLWRPSQVEGTIWVQPCEAYKISKVSDFNSEQLVLVASPDEESTRRFFADQLITRTVRDEEQTKRNMKLAAEIAMKYNYRLSLQLHKQLGLP